MRRAVHTWRLLREFGSYAVINRAYWVLPFILLLLGIAAFIVVVETVAPFTLYSLF
jgi:hypothetical protein